MKEKLINVLKFLLFLSLGLFLFWLAYRDMSWQEIVDSTKDAQFFWLGVSVFFGVLSHLSRAARWNLLIEPLGYRPRFLNTFFAVMVMYLANLAIPRLGEVTRCGIMKRYENVPFTKLLGTVFLERIVDFVMLLLLLVFVIVTQFPVVLEFINNNPEIASKFEWIFNSQLTLVILACMGLAAVLAFIFLRKYVRHLGAYQKVKKLTVSFIDGFKTILQMKRKLTFFAHSVFIYLMYFGMIYVAFFAFDFTSHLGIMSGLAVFTISSFGMVAPVQGGIGAWHFMAYKTLLIFGVPEDPEGKTFAFVAHATMTILLIVLGFISLVALPLYNRNKTTATTPTAEEDA